MFVDNANIQFYFKKYNTLHSHPASIKTERGCPSKLLDNPFWYIYQYATSRSLPSGSRG